MKKVNKQTGFTLLELIVVVAVLGLIASVATEYIVMDSNQTRFVETEHRVDKIRFAIIGDDNRTINGQPTISGFVTDTGELPKELRELFLEEYCENAVYFSSADCTNNSSNWIVQQNWNGPYLKPSGIETIIDGEGTERKIPVFRDAWGNHGATNAEDWANFGWEFNRVKKSGSDWIDDDSAFNLKVQSIGLDAVGGPNNLSDSSAAEYKYESDYPALDAFNYPLIISKDYLGGSNEKEISIKLVNNSANPVGVCLTWDGIGAPGSENFIASGSGQISASGTVNHSFESTMGHLTFTATVDTDNNCSTSDSSTINIEFVPSNTIAVHESVLSKLEIRFN